MLQVQAKKPVLYVGGGCLNAWQELREFVAQTGIPVTQTLMGLGTFDATDPLSLHVSPRFDASHPVCTDFHAIMNAGRTHQAAALFAFIILCPGYNPAPTEKSKNVLVGREAV